MTSSASTIDLTRYRDVPVLVTGASGFIGRWVARALTAVGADVVLAVRRPESMGSVAERWNIRGTTTTLALESESEVRELVERVQPAITFNLAGYGVDRSERDAATSHRVNVEAVDWLASAIAELGGERAVLPQQLVHVGSALEYGNIGGDLREDAPGQPGTQYGRDKLAGTMVVSRHGAGHGLRALTARLFTVYGPGEHAGRLLPSLLEAAGGHDEVRLSAGTQSRDFTYVEDVASGLLRLGLSDMAPGSVVNLATGRLQTVRRFVESAADVLGLASSRLNFGALPMREDEMVHTRVATERLRDALGWVPATTVADGVRAAVDFSEMGATSATAKEQH